MSENENKVPLHIEPGGFQKLVGYDVVEWGPGLAELTIELSHHHSNSHGFVHGGVLMTLLDAACTRAGALDPESSDIRRSTTVSMTTNFLAPAKEGRLKVIARKTGGGRRIFFTTADVYNEDESLVASAIATCRYS
jgi:uncharacterized protein (TIGR00369 family)